MKSEYFDIRELVSEQVFQKYGEDMCWAFFDPRLITMLDWMKETFGWTIIINNWMWGGQLSQRGLRENLCQICLNKTDDEDIYLSGHVLGMSVDFDVVGVTAYSVRNEIISYKYELPYPIRIEKDTTWVHLGVDNAGHSKIELFPNLK